MIEIIIEPVDMPELKDRRYQKKPLDPNGNKWMVIDTHENKYRYKGKFEDASIACHNLNKAFYKIKKSNHEQ